jgi:predicted glycoside hydrolase/deacetylase ChbG (UPF0249 family)
VGRRLIVNADDFGFTPDVNEGIVEAHRNGILTAATLMANGAAFEHAVALAHCTPTLDVGCHLVIVQGASVLNPARLLPGTVPELLQALMLGRLNIYDELAAQVKKIVGAGIRPSHLDTHKHTHLLPPVLRAVARIAREFGIPWVRRPFDFPGAPGAGWKARAVSKGMHLAEPGFRRTLRGLRTTDHFAGFQITGRLDTESLIATLESLPEGLTELMCHPGHLGPDLAGAVTRLKESRAIELKALTSPDVRRVIESRGIQLVSFRDLSEPRP